jgi:hypothetical protein
MRSGLDRGFLSIIRPFPRPSGDGENFTDEIITVGPFMVGQGSPNTLLTIVRRFADNRRNLRRQLGRPIALRRTLLVALFWLFCAGISQADSTIQLRLAWGGGTRKQWQGTVSVDRGSLGLVRLLSEESDAPGSIWEEHGRIEICQPDARSFDAIDFTVTAPSDAVLSIELHDAVATNAAPSLHEVPLRDLLSKPANRELDKLNNRISIRRPSFDLLRVKPRHDHLVFSPGETLKFDVEPQHLPVAAGTSLQIRARIISAGNGPEFTSQEQSIKTTAEGADPATLSWQFKLPENEGVYDVVIEAIEQSVWRLPKTKQIAERRMQLVVIGDRTHSAAPEANVAWSRVMEIDPANPAWWERFRGWSLFPGLRQGPLGNGGAQTWQHPSLGPMVQLKAHRADQEAFWEAYPLSISHPGLPHVLEVEYPSNVPQTLGISIVEPNAAGWVVPIGLDSGFFVVEEPTTNTPAKILRHRILFWPRTSAPMVLLANRAVGAPATYGKIRVLAGPNKLPPMFPVGEVSERLLAGFMSRPLMAENFGAAETLDPASGRSLDDWRTFYLAATRLAEYLHHVGYNGQMLGVMAEGSTIYPSRHLQATPQYDNGEAFETGQDPLRKDALELTLRLFDREGLKLIPSLRFDAPLPELEERLRAGGAAADGIRLIGASGEEYIDRSRPFSSQVPHYNPLNPHVQEAMLAIVREIVQRYGKHPSFAGLSLEMSADSFTQLPGEAWGLDDDTIARFQQATNVKISGEGPTRFTERAKVLSPLDRSRFTASAEHAQWLEWRAQVLADFYRRIQAELTVVRRDAVLYLAGSNLFDGQEAQEWLRPTLPPKARIDEVLLTLGLRPDLLRQDRGLVFLRPQRVLPPGPIADQGVLTIVNQASELDAAFNRLPATGSLLLHDPLLLRDPKHPRLTSFDAKSPYGKDKTVTVPFSHLLPSDRRNRERFVHALAALDAEAIFDGGWLLPLGQEESLYDLVAAYRRLPAGKFETHADLTSPVTIRSRSSGKSTYAYFANDCQWPITVNLQTVAPPGCRVDELSGHRRLPALSADNWQIQLEPFDFLAIRFWAPDVKIAKAAVLPNPQLQQWLVSRKSEFQQRLEMLASPPKLPMPANSSFESPMVSGQTPGWSLLNPAAGTLSLVPENTGPKEKPVGKQALRFQSTGPKVSLRSEAFAVPPSRRVSVVVWLRVPDANRQPSLQLVIEDGKSYRKAGLLGLGAASTIGDQWSSFEYRVKDLPQDGTTQLRFGFDLAGPGEVLIDDVQIFDLAYDPSERLHLSKLELVIEGQLRDGEFGECLRKLDSYWPRFISTYVPSPQALAQQPNRPDGGQPAKDQEKPSRSARPLEKWFKR